MPPVQPARGYGSIWGLEDAAAFVAAGGWVTLVLWTSYLGKGNLFLMTKSLTATALTLLIAMPHAHACKRAPKSMEEAHRSAVSDTIKANSQFQGFQIKEIIKKDRYFEVALEKEMEKIILFFQTLEGNDCKVTVRQLASPPK